MASSADAEQHVTSPSASNGPFPYPPIDPQTEIRILELYPPDFKDLLRPRAEEAEGSGKTRLRGKFVVAKLAEKPQYEALSYAWASPSLMTKSSFQRVCYR